jgi:hypothetical protein
MHRNEEFYQVIVEDWLGGSHHTLPIAVTDVSTDKVHAEIKTWRKWKYALGQLTAYQDDCPKEELHMYMFGAYAVNCKQKALKTLNNKGIKCYEFKEDTRDGNKYVHIIDVATGLDVFQYSLQGF